jgi:hypothetical protein
MLNSNRLKDLYVPSPGTGDAPSGRQYRPLLDRELSQIPAGQLFRSVDWDGTGVEPTTKPNPRLADFDPRQPVSAFFSSIPWTGEALPEPTDQQARLSVRTILSQFNWETGE